MDIVCFVICGVIGNELSGSGVGTQVQAKQYASDVIALRKIIEEVYNKDNEIPLLVAPDGFFDETWTNNFLQATIATTSLSIPTIDVLSHHIYNLGAGNFGFWL